MSSFMYATCVHVWIHPLYGFLEVGSLPSTSVQTSDFERCYQSPFLKFLLTDLPAKTTHSDISSFHILNSVYPPLLALIHTGCPKYLLPCCESWLKSLSSLLNSKSPRRHILRTVCEGIFGRGFNWSLILSVSCRDQIKRRKEAKYQHSSISASRLWALMSGEASWPCQPHILPHSGWSCQKSRHSDGNVANTPANPIKIQFI